MRVLHLLSSTGFHGAEHMAAELIRRTDALGVTNFVGAFHNNARSNLDVVQATAAHAAGARVFDCNGRIDARTIFALRQFVRANRIEIIHSHKYKTNLYSLLASAGLKCGLVATCHNWLTDSAALKIYAALDKIILRRFDAAVGVSTEVVRQLRHWLPDRKVHQVANGVDIERYRSAVATDQAKRTLGIAGKHVVGFVGRLSAAKGVSVLLHAATKLRERLTNFCVVIVGDGDYRGDLMRQAQTLGLESEVRFLGERADTPLIYSALDVLVLPSFNEAFPMVILEAMASGTPVVATRVGDVEHIVEDKVTGRLVEPGDAEGLCEAIEDFLLNKHHAASAAEQARARVIGRFSSTAMAESYCSIYRQMLDRNGHTRAPLHGT